MTKKELEVELHETLHKFQSLQHDVYRFIDSVDNLMQQSAQASNINMGKELSTLITELEISVQANQPTVNSLDA